MSQPRLLDAPTGLRSATVLHYGAGQPVSVLIVQIDGLAEPLPILAPPRNPPAVGARIAVRENVSATRARFWTYAGQEGDK